MTLENLEKAKTIKKKIEELNYRLKLLKSESNLRILIGNNRCDFRVEQNEPVGIFKTLLLIIQAAYENELSVLEKELAEL